MRDILSSPSHIAIVMDGNGRWAKRRLLPRVAGHQQGVESFKRCVKACIQRSVKVLTVFAFSSENWKRPEEEISGLMELMLKALKKEVSQLDKKGVRLYFVGNREQLSDNIKQAFGDAEQLTSSNTKLIVNVCFNYGGRWDMAQAAAKLVVKNLDITPANINAEMALAHVADPDFIIRTGGEKRLSNFLLWQAIYSEFYFCDTLWPDFDDKALDLAIESFHQRERRFGKTSEQVLTGSHA